MRHERESVRAVALVGPAGTGKTSLAEALLFAAGAIDRQGTVAAGTCIGDWSPEARARGGSTELNLMQFDHLGDGFVLIDSPGAPGFAADAARAVAACDLAIVVVDPDPARATLVGPTLARLDALGIPHILFVNKIDGGRGSIRALLEALQPASAGALVARQIPIREAGEVTGFVDLALERAWRYRAAGRSEPIDVPEALRPREQADRFHMLEQLADHDDALLEQLVTDQAPSLETIFADLERETGANLVVPVLFGSAANGWGMRRLLKSLRHDVPAPSRAAARLGIDRGLFVAKVSNAYPIGRLAIGRLFGVGLGEGAELVACDGKRLRAGSMVTLQGASTNRVASAIPGAFVALAKLDGVTAGDVLGTGGVPLPVAGPAAPPAGNHQLAIAVQDHKDEVRLATALARLVEEDAALRWRQDDASRQTLICGVDEEHLGVAIERLRRRYGIALRTSRPTVPYRETIRIEASQRGRHKKQSGGHGQFGDVLVDVRPLPRGEGFRFADRISGGVVPKQWIPAVEQGARDALAKGPLGFPVVDIEVVLVDGSYHSVDSSELAFRTAGRLAVAEALPRCRPYLLEPIWRVAVQAPAGSATRIGSAIAARRGQILGLGPAGDLSGWDRVDGLVPEAELHDLGAELRALSQGLATYTAEFAQLSEVAPKQAEEIVQRMHRAA